MKVYRVYAERMPSDGKHRLVHADSGSEATWLVATHLEPTDEYYRHKRHEGMWAVEVHFDVHGEVEQAWWVP